MKQACIQAKNAGYMTRQYLLMIALAKVNKCVHSINFVRLIIKEQAAPMCLSIQYQRNAVAKTYQVSCRAYPHNRQ